MKKTTRHILSPALSAFILAALCSLTTALAAFSTHAAETAADPLLQNTLLSTAAPASSQNILFPDGRIFQTLSFNISDTGRYVSSFSRCGQSAPLYISPAGGDGLENIWSSVNNGAVEVPGAQLSSADVQATRLKAAWWARAICDSPYHGYDTGSRKHKEVWPWRYGLAKAGQPCTGDYCCSSLALCAYYFAGVNVIGENLGGPDARYIPNASLPFSENKISYYYNGQHYSSGTNSYNMINFLNLFGFTDVVGSFKADKKNFMFLTGDIVIYSGHVQLVLSDGNRKSAQTAQARGADPKHLGGDQTGGEICVQTGVVRPKKIIHIFRFTGQGVVLNTAGL